MRWLLFCMLSVNSLSPNGGVGRSSEGGIAEEQRKLKRNNADDCADWRPDLEEEDIDCIQPVSTGTLKALNYLRYVSRSLDNGSISELEDLENMVAGTPVNESISLAAGKFVLWLYKIPLDGQYEGLDICASESKVSRECNASTGVDVQLPAELPVNAEHKFAFITVSLPQTAASVLVNSSDHLLNNRLISLSVENRSVSGLQEFVNISMDITTSQSDSHRPQCVFLNYTTHKLDTDGCRTQWEPGESHLVCSCDHLTFFGVLMIAQLPQADVSILTYMTFAGCSVSFCALLIAVLLITASSHVKSDSMKIHVNLAVALLLLNLHFLPNTAVGIWHFRWPSIGFCFYLAIALHFSLLASFCWMGVEAFNLYLLVVKVVDIHVRKYLFKVCLVGWGVPVIVVGIVVSINIHFYGPVLMWQSKATDDHICYIREDIVKYATTLGPFSLMCLFNLIVLIMVVRKIVGLHKGKKTGPGECNRAIKKICTLMGVITFLGTTWGLIFFSFGHLSTIGLYAFCILNPLQGLFISLWLCVYVAKEAKTTRLST